jgi:hypothetical protein
MRRCLTIYFQQSVPILSIVPSTTSVSNDRIHVLDSDLDLLLSVGLEDSVVRAQGLFSKLFLNDEFFPASSPSINDDNEMD